RGFEQDRQNLAQFPFPAPRKKPDQVRVSCDHGAATVQTFEHRVSHENRSQPRLIVELGFERENAEHEIEITRHLWNPPTIPGPNLRADVIDNFPIWSPKCSMFMERTCQ